MYIETPQRKEEERVRTSDPRRRRLRWRSSRKRSPPPRTVDHNATGCSIGIL